MEENPINLAFSNFPASAYGLALYSSINSCACPGATISVEVLKVSKIARTARGLASL